MIDTSCSTCHGAPPKGYTCLSCLRYTWPDGHRPYEGLARFGDVEIPDPDALEPAWDHLMELAGGMHPLALNGISPIVISRLFQIALDSVKETSSNS